MTQIAIANALTSTGDLHYSAMLHSGQSNDLVIRSIIQFATEVSKVQWCIAQKVLHIHISIQGYQSIDAPYVLCLYSHITLHHNTLRDPTNGRGVIVIKVYTVQILSYQLLG